MSFYILKESKQRLVYMVISDYVHKKPNKLWLENSEMTGLKDCERCQENILLSLAEKNWIKTMNGSFLINLVRPGILPYNSKIPGKASFFPFTLFRV